MIFTVCVQQYAISKGYDSNKSTHQVRVQSKSTHKTCFVPEKINFIFLSEISEVTQSISRSNNSFYLFLKLNYTHKNIILDPMSSCVVLF